MKREFNKLVRDKIPEKIESNGETAYTRILDDEEYKRELENKILEEYEEMLAASGKERVEELADMLEIIKCLAKLENSSLDDVIDVANQKVLKRGSFDRKIFLERTE